MFRQKYKQAPNKWDMDVLRLHLDDGPRVQVGSRIWAPARPCGLDTFRSRIKLAWAVFTGRADALFWRNQNDK